MIFVTLILCLTIVILLVRRRQTVFQEWKTRGVKGPEPNFFFGNSFEFYYNGHVKTFEKWVQKYGEVLGYFNGIRPVMLITDVDIIKQIQVKHFTNFIDRGTLDGPAPRGHFLTALRGQRWKKARSTLTPAFTISKLKAVTSSVSEIVDEFLTKLDNLSSTSTSPIEIYVILQALTTDVITRTALGVNYEALKDPRSPIMNRLRAHFSASYNFLLMTVLSFPAFVKLSPYVLRFSELLNNNGDSFRNPSAVIIEDCAKVIKMRRFKRERRNDVLQLLMDARYQDMDFNALTVDDESEKREKERQVKSSMTGEGLSDVEVKQNAFLVMSAGYETTSNTLASLCHALMMNPHVQQKLKEEIKEKIVEEGKELDFDSLQSLPYMEAVVKETLRLFCPVFRITRECTSQCEINGVLFRKGDIVVIPTTVLHTSKKLFADPLVFRPERFIDGEVNPFAFQAFGNGPRNCIGMRFAQLEIKMTIAKILLRYQIVKTDSTPENLIFNYSLNIQKPSSNIYCKLLPQSL